MGNHDREELEDDRGTDVGHDAQGEDGQPLESPSGEHVDEAEERSLGLGEKSGQGRGIDPRRGDMNADAVDGQEQKGLMRIRFFSSGILGIFWNPWNTALDDLRFSSSRFNLLLGGKTESRGLERSKAGRFPLPPGSSPRNQLSSPAPKISDFPHPPRLLREIRPNPCRLTISHSLTERVFEPPFGEATLEGHLPPFETWGPFST